VSVDLATLKARLRECGILKFKDHENHVIFGVQEGKHQIGMVASLQEKGEYLVVRTVALANRSLKGSENQAALSALSAVNFDPRCVKVSYDPSDDEVVVEADVPLDGHDTLTQEQVGVLLTLVVTTSIKVLEALEANPPGKGTSTSRPPKKDPPPPDRDKPQSSPGPSFSGGGSSQASMNPVMMVIALGILLLGVAAVGGVLVMLIK
jgi:hypothetical protein